MTTIGSEPERPTINAEISPSGRRFVIGVLSDTHGYLYPEVRRLLEGADYIIHAGDIGSPQVLALLRSIAPVAAVRGNCDHGFWAESLPTHMVFEIEGTRVLVGHVLDSLRPPANAGGLIRGAESCAVVIFGHSHQVSLEERQQVLWLNPGSAGPCRFGRPRTLARLEISSREESEAAPGCGMRPQIDVSILNADGGAL